MKNLQNAVNIFIIYHYVFTDYDCFYVQQIELCFAWAARPYGKSLMTIIFIPKLVMFLLFLET